MKTEITNLQTQAENVINQSLVNKFSGNDGHVLEHVSQMLFTNGTLDEDLPYLLKETCTELLALIADPEISSKLPEYVRPNLGQNLLRMTRFFDAIDDPACLDAFALYEVKNCSPGEERLRRLIKAYSSAETIEQSSLETLKVTLPAL